MTRWLFETPLILASKSQARQTLLRDCGISFETCPADLDERALENKNALQSHEAIALMLAQAKAQAVSAKMKNRLVLAADQILALGETRLHQCTDREEAINQLQNLSGKTHHLIAVAVLRDTNGQSVEWIEKAEMKMRALSRQETEAYLDLEGPAVLKSVGCYHYESHGRSLFEHVNGALQVILGMPMQGLEQHLIDKGYLRA
jgi:septum formation protein